MVRMRTFCVLGGWGYNIVCFEKRNLDSCSKSCIIKIIEPTTPLIFLCATRWDFLFIWSFMYKYPKQILTISQQVQSYIDAGMEIGNQSDVEKVLKTVGYYRLRGYSFHLYDNNTKKYVPGTKFENRYWKFICYIGR